MLLIRLCFSLWGLRTVCNPRCTFRGRRAHELLGEVGVAGGWGQAGGHGPLTSRYGLGVDQVLEYQVVTADGQVCRNYVDL
jgi:hypothetical protein